MICLQGVELEQVTFADLATRHDGCAGPEASGSGPCHAAIHRHCQSRGAISGFGGLELSPNSMLLSCIRDPSIITIRHTRYSVLSTHHGPCNGTRQRWGPDCNAAMKRWCRSEGFLSGFGPLENNGDTVVVACVNP